MKTRPYVTAAKITLATSIGLYLISLTRECYCVTGSCGDHWSGLYLVALGAIGGIMSVAGLTWYANPLLWVAWSLINKSPQRTVLFSLAAAIIAASFLLATKITDVRAGRSSFITDYRSGYWLWLASMVTMLIGSILVYLLKRKEWPAERLALLKVDFNNRRDGGVKLVTKGATARQGNNKKIRLYDDMRAIVWDEDYDNDKADNLAVEALVKYSNKHQCWIAWFNNDDLKHESQREKPLLDNWD
ncbi:hypothetical protein [Mucilaginibacter sp. UR6-11]|uniref:hypothetical protein n=1 Tax=Mucilaginibacter sp. UR6-11 TaxID=1435644 RepID=UPI001E4CD85B|nr:hypothetical protein [Mucilaginibacter sp. UR6-11]MCC8425927.1 hypothetical protein [Mucilaginibacter sp. UR6-11]